jgi:hypothetical protein
MFQPQYYNRLVVSLMVSQVFIFQHLCALYDGENTCNNISEINSYSPGIFLKLLQAYWNKEISYLLRYFN